MEEEKTLGLRSSLRSDGVCGGLVLVSLHKTALSISAGVFAAVLAFIGLDGAGFKEMIALIIAACMAVSCPFLLIGCFKRAKLFPERIEISGEHLYIGGEHFN